METHTPQSDLNFNLGEQKELLRQEIQKLVARECPRQYVEEMAKKSASVALTFMMSSCFGAKALAFAGNEKQKQDLLPPLARGQVMFAISITEPDGGTD